MVIGFEQHLVVHDGAQQLGAFGRAEQQCPVPRDEIDREDFGPTIQSGDEPAERAAGQQVPALVLGEFYDRLVC
jgi:hypothetical protein